MWDADGNPEVGVWVAEEPDCGGCNDRGRLWNGRRCGCNPGRLSRLLAPLRLRWSLVMHRRRGQRSDGPAPF
jgi:hypothetical protein